MSRFVMGIILLACVGCFRGQERGEGYVVNHENGLLYKLVYVAQPWEKAVEYCVREKFKLAVPRSQEEFQFLQSIVRAMHYPSIVGADSKLLVWLGIYNLGDYRIWRNVYGENIKDTGFHKWAPHNGVGYSDNPAEPHCGAIDAINPGYREYWCKKPQPYICQKSISDMDESDMQRLNN